jgi:hypothetical protein
VDAQAGVIYTDLKNFPLSFDSDKALGLPGNAEITFGARHSVGPSYGYWSVYARGANGAFLKIKGFGLLKTFNAGATSGSGGSAGFGLVGYRSLFPGGSSVLGETFSHKYALFRFVNTAHSGDIDYGWIRLSQELGPGVGPNVTLEAWAYDDSGNQIAAGAGDLGAVPEPSSFTLAGLGALALGAAGLRRWRGARTA